MTEYLGPMITDNVMEDISVDSEAGTSQEMNNEKVTDAIDMNESNKENVMTENQEDCPKEINSSLKDEEFESIFLSICICPICQGEYCNETGDPKTLPCGHSVCTNCLNIISHTITKRRSITCPTCRETNKSNTDKDFPISLTIKNFLTKYKNREKDIRTSMPLDSDKSKEVLGVCLLHTLPFHFGCMTCSQWLCGRCVCKVHLGEKKKCKVFRINEAIIRMRDQAEKELQERVKQINTFKSQNTLILDSSKQLSNFYDNKVSILSSYIKNVKELKENFKNQNKLVDDLAIKVQEVETQWNTRNNVKEIMTGLKDLKETRNTFSRRWLSQNVYFFWENLNEFTQCTRNALKTFKISLDEDKKVTNCIRVLTYSPDVSKFEMRVQTATHVHLNMNLQFYDFTNRVFYPYIDVSDENNSEIVRVKFEVDRNELGFTFLMQCYDKHTMSFTNSRICMPFRYSSSICFGNKPKYVNIKTNHQIKDKNQYCKPITIGAIGAYTYFEHSNTIMVYINTDLNDSDCHNIPYFSYPKAQNLNLCFGRVVEGLDDLKKLLMNSDEPLTIKKSGIIIED